MMLIGLCNNCQYYNESETAICSKENCPLMIEKSPFKFPFSDGRRLNEPRLPPKQSAKSEGLQQSKGS